MAILVYYSPRHPAIAEMTDDSILLNRVRDALRADLLIGFDEQSIVLTLSGGDLVIEGVTDVAVKGRMLRKAAEAIESRFIVGRLHVRPAHQSKMA